jgi:hypothetical protein
VKTREQNRDFGSVYLPRGKKINFPFQKKEEYKFSENPRATAI